MYDGRADVHSEATAFEVVLLLAPASLLCRNLYFFLSIAHTSTYMFASYIDAPSFCAGWGMTLAGATGAL